MHKVWYLVIVERYGAARFTARTPDIPELIALGATETEAVASITNIIAYYVRGLAENREGPPRTGLPWEIARGETSKMFSRRVVEIEIPAELVWPSPQLSMGS